MPTVYNVQRLLFTASNWNGAAMRFSSFSIVVLATITSACSPLVNGCNYFDSKRSTSDMEFYVATLENDTTIVAVSSCPNTPASLRFNSSGKDAEKAYRDFISQSSREIPGQILTVYIHGRGRIAPPDNTNREPTIEIEKIYSIEKSDPPIHLREALLLDLPSPR